MSDEHLVCIRCGFGPPVLFGFDAAVCGRCGDTIAQMPRPVIHVRQPETQCKLVPGENACPECWLLHGRKQELRPEHGHERCDACGYRSSCCM